MRTLSICDRHSAGIGSARGLVGGSVVEVHGHRHTDVPIGASAHPRPRKATHKKKRRHECRRADARAHRQTGPRLRARGEHHAARRRGAQRKSAHCLSAQGAGVYRKRLAARWAVSSSPRSSWSAATPSATAASARARAQRRGIIQKTRSGAAARFAGARLRETCACPQSARRPARGGGLPVALLSPLSAAPRPPSLPGSASSPAFAPGASRGAPSPISPGCSMPSARSPPQQRPPSERPAASCSRAASSPAFAPG